MTSEDTSPSAPLERRRRRWLRRTSIVLAVAALGVVSVVITTWAALAICFADLPGVEPRYGRAVLYLVAVITAIVFVRPKRLRWVVAPACFLAVLVWFFS